MSSYPEWLGAKLINDEFDWAKAASSSMPKFLSAYTLHDSHWISFHLQPNLASVAIFHWDTIWAQGRIQADGVPLNGCFLLVRLARVWQVHTSFYISPQGWRLGEIIGSAEPQLVSEGERERLLEQLTQNVQVPDEQKEFVLDEPLYHTIFHHIFSGRMDVWHAGETKFLCLADADEQLYIPDL